MVYVNDDDTNNPPLPGLGRLGGLGMVPPPPPPNTLPGLIARPEVQGLYYNGQTLALDGYRFVRCRFDNCTLYVSSTNFDLIHCVIDSSTSVVYGSSVIKAIQLFNSRHSWAYQQMPEFAPKVNADGTITIVGQ